MILFSDFHADAHSEFARPWKDGCNTRLKSQMDVLTRIFEITQEEGEHTLVFLGDWFHRWKAVDTSVASMVSRTLYDLLDRHKDVSLVMMPGNHDMPNKNNPSVSTIDPYSAHSRIRVISSPSIVEIEGDPFAFVPYLSDHAKMRDNAVELSKKAKESWLFSHIDIVGAVASIDGYTASGGVCLEDLEVFSGGVFGHYHMPQDFESRGKKNFHYVGSPMQLSWVDQQAGKTAESVRGVMRFRDGRVDRIPIDSPKFVKVDKAHEGKLRSQDYHLVTCSIKDADDVHREWEKKLSGDSNFRVVPVSGEDKEEKPVVFRLSQADDAIETYAKTRGHLCECDLSTLISYGKYYYNSGD